MPEQVTIPISRSTNEIDQLKILYRFQHNEKAEAFLSSNPGAGSVLINALPKLRTFFGADVVFNLEVMAEDGEPQVLYAVAVWRGPLEGAVAALENFDEKWWLDQPTRGLALTFTYELV